MIMCIYISLLLDQILDDIILMLTRRDLKGSAHML